jgi:hypothetical protein
MHAPSIGAQYRRSASQMAKRMIRFAIAALDARSGANNKGSVGTRASGNESTREGHDGHCNQG